MLKDTTGLSTKSYVLEKVTFLFSAKFIDPVLLSGCEI